MLAPVGQVSGLGAGRADLLRALHRRRGLRGHVPPGRPALHDRPEHADGAEGGGAARARAATRPTCIPVGDGLLLGVGDRASSDEQRAVRAASSSSSTSPNPAAPKLLAKTLLGSGSSTPGDLRPPRVPVLAADEPRRAAGADRRRRCRQPGRRRNGRPAVRRCDRLPRRPGRDRGARTDLARPGQRARAADRAVARDRQPAVHPSRPGVSSPRASIRSRVRASRPSRRLPRCPRRFRRRCPCRRRFPPRASASRRADTPGAGPLRHHGVSCARRPPATVPSDMSEVGSPGAPRGSPVDSLSRSRRCMRGPRRNRR